MSRRIDLSNAGFPIGEDGKSFCYLDYVGGGLYALFVDESCTGEPVVRARTACKLIDLLDKAGDINVVIAPFVEVVWCLEVSDCTEVWDEDAMGQSLFETGHPSDDEEYEDGDTLLETAWSRRRGLGSA